MILPHSDNLNSNEIRNDRLRIWMALGLVLLISALVRYWDINARSLWFDEAYEFWVSRSNIVDLWKATATSYQPPLFNFLLHFWMKVSTSEVWLRTLSVFFSLVGIAGVFITANKFFGVKAAVMAGLVLAVMPADVRYAQELGEYALLFSICSWLIYFHLYVIEKKSWRGWGICLILWLSGIYTHYGAVIVIFSLSLINLIYSLYRRDFQNIIKQVIVSLVFFLLALPLGSLLFEQMSRQNSSTIIFGNLWTELKVFFQSPGKTFAFPILGFPWTIISISWINALLIIIFFLMVYLLFKGPKKQRILWYFFLASYFTYYILVRLGFYAYGGFGFRYMIVLLPIFVLIMVGVLYESFTGQFKVPIIALLLIGALLGISIYSLPNRSLSEKTRGKMAWPEIEDMRNVVDTLSKGNKHFPVYVYYGAVPAYSYYSRDTQFELEADDLPSTWISTCWSEKNSFSFCTPGRSHFGLWNRGLTEGELALSIMGVFKEPPSNFYLVFSHTYSNEDTLSIESLEKYAGYELVSKDSWSNASLYLVTKKNQIP